MDKKCALPVYFDPLAKFILQYFPSPSPAYYDTPLPFIQGRRVFGTLSKIYDRGFYEEKRLLDNFFCKEDLS